MGHTGPVGAGRDHDFLHPVGARFTRSHPAPDLRWAITGAIITVIIVIAVVFTVSAVSAFLMLRGVNVLTMLAHWIGQQTEKLRARQKAEGLAEKDAEWREWYERQIANGAALDDPPPQPPPGTHDKE